MPAYELTITQCEDDSEIQVELVACDGSSFDDESKAKDILQICRVMLSNEKLMKAMTEECLRYDKMIEEVAALNEKAMGGNE